MNSLRWRTDVSSMPVIAFRGISRKPTSNFSCMRTNGFREVRDASRRSSSVCATSRYRAIVGTSVRESRYDASIAKHTASASGTNRYFATPDRKNIGTNTMQIESVETSAGTAICEAPSRIACTISLPWSKLRLMFSTSTVASSTRIPTASASPPSVMMLIVSPSALKTISEVKIESGIDTAMMIVLRQLPRKQQNHQARKPRRDGSFANHALDRRAHKQRLVRHRMDIHVRSAATPG